MSSFNLLEVEPNKVTTDLTSYITFLYGKPKCGKTTFAAQMPDSLLIAFEKGYSAIPGVKAIDVTTWGEFKKVVRELKKDEVKKAYKGIAIDTVDIAADLCQKYICNQLGIESIGEGGWTNNGWDKYKKEFRDVLREISMMGYAMIFISHDKEKPLTDPSDGREYVQIRPTLQNSALEIIENMVDIYGYAHSKKATDGTSKVVLTLRDSNDVIRCGGRFKRISPEIDFTYESLEEAIKEAISKESAENENKFITSDRKDGVITEYNFSELKNKFSSITTALMEKDRANSTVIVATVEKYLGKGKKVTDCTEQQSEQLDLIISDLENYI